MNTLKQIFKLKPKNFQTRSFQILINEKDIESRTKLECAARVEVDGSHVTMKKRGGGFATVVGNTKAKITNAVAGIHHTGPLEVELMGVYFFCKRYLKSGQSYEVYCDCRNALIELKAMKKLIDQRLVYQKIQQGILSDRTGRRMIMSLALEICIEMQRASRNSVILRCQREDNKIARHLANLMRVVVQQDPKRSDDVMTVYTTRVVDFSPSFSPISDD